MKKILAFLALGLLLGACSGKLSSSKAEDLVKESLEENPMYGEIAIYTGEIKENPQLPYQVHFHALQMP